MGQYQQLFYNEELSKKIAKEAIHACERESSPWIEFLTHTIQISVPEL
jgi:hypothetical protein